MEKHGQDKNLLVGILAVLLFVIMGGAMVYWGFYFYNNVQSLRATGTRTEGTILRYKRLEGPKINERMVVPVVEFQTQAGNTVVVEGAVDNVSVLKNLCSSGERVEIIYDPEKPGHAVINTFSELWFAPFLLWFIGVGFMIVPPYTVWTYFKDLKRQSF